MRKTLYLMAVIAIATALAACNSGQSANEADTRNDSIEAANQEMKSFLELVAVSMDSIAMSNEMMFITSNEEGVPLTDKQKILDNIDKFELTFQRQRQRIEELEKLLETTKSEHSQKMKEVIASMKKQLEAKDQEIAMLREEISQRDFNISRLQERVTTLHNNVNELTAKNKEQEEALTTQSDMMNEAYVLIGTKGELKAAGVLAKANLLSKSKLDMSSINTSAFSKIDIREKTEFQIAGKSPKILTQAPSGSYSITSNGDGTSTLTITNPADFWSVSNYLVVQSK